MNVNLKMFYHNALKHKTRPRADCGSDHEPLIAKFRLKLKKVGKTTGSFRYDLNQITYAYTVEVTNRFKGLDLYRSLWSKPSLRGGVEGMQKSKMVV